MMAYEFLNLANVTCFFSSKYPFIPQDSKYVKAKYDYITNESTLLSFKQGDVIKLVAKGNLSDGWLYGELRSSEGYFPAEYVTGMSEVGWV